MYPIMLQLGREYSSRKKNSKLKRKFQPHSKTPILIFSTNTNFTPPSENQGSNYQGWSETNDTAEGVKGNTKGYMCTVSVIRYIGSVLLWPRSTTARITDAGTRASYSLAGVYMDKIF